MSIATRTRVAETYLGLAGSRRVLLNDFYEENINTLHRFLRSRLSNNCDIEDIAQEAYFRLCLADANGGVTNLHAFLFQTARNLVVDHYRRRNFSGRMIDERYRDLDSQPDASQVPIEHAAAIDEQLVALDQAISDLPSRCRQVFVMYRLREKTQREISSELGISRQMVEKHVAKAVASCRKRLTGADGRSGQANPACIRSRFASSR